MENLSVVPSFEELSVEEMEAIQGSGDVQAETTPVCAVVRRQLQQVVLLVVGLVAVFYWSNCSCVFKTLLKYTIKLSEVKHSAK